MVVGAIGGRTELVVIGAGPGGYVAALRAADAGLEVTLIERDQLGGTCLNVGCIPSKALIELANLRDSAISSATRGLHAAVTVDADKIAGHLKATSRQLRSGVTALLQDAGVTVVTGDASFARYDRLSIAQNDQVSHLEFDNAIIATGSRPVELANLPFSGSVVSSTGALALTEVPKSMVIVGGGYIGVELGTAWAKLGANVTIVDAADSILPATAADLRRPVERRLAELGIDVSTGTMVDTLTDAGVALSDGRRLDADIVVVAVGRVPNSDRASIDTLRLQLTATGHIEVDGQMRATSGIYAIGDLVPGPALAHKATAEAEIAVDAILGRAGSGPRVIPSVIFSDPEIMSVGVEIEEAQRRDLDVHRFPHAASARARTIGAVTGATYLVADERGTVVGVHAVGPHVSELAGEATLAIEMAATIEDVALTVHPHPTMSETLAEAALLAGGHPLHVRR